MMKVHVIHLIPGKCEPTPANVYDNWRAAIRRVRGMIETSWEMLTPEAKEHWGGLADYKIDKLHALTDNGVATLAGGVLLTWDEVEVRDKHESKSEDEG